MPKCPYLEQTPIKKEEKYIYIPAHVNSFAEQSIISPHAKPRRMQLFLGKTFNESTASFNWMTFLRFFVSASNTMSDPLLVPTTMYFIQLSMQRIRPSLICIPCTLYTNKNKNKIERKKDI